MALLRSIVSRTGTVWGYLMMFLIYEFYCHVTCSKVGSWFLLYSPLPAMQSLFALPLLCLSMYLSVWSSPVQLTSERDKLREAEKIISERNSKVGVLPTLPSAFPACSMQPPVNIFENQHFFIPSNRLIKAVTSHWSARALIFCIVSRLSTDAVQSFITNACYTIRP